jgi:cytidyltransferase-like protein
MIIDLKDPVSVEAARLYCGKNGVLRIGITSGCFDTFHYYHLIFLERCKQLCDMLLVGVDSDRRISETKGPDRPVVNERHRLTIVNALKCVDACFILDSLPQFAKICDLFIRNKEYGLVFRNQDWAGKEDEVEVGNSHARVVVVPDIEELTSTSDMIQKIEAKAKKKKK